MNAQSRDPASVPETLRVRICYMCKHKVTKIHFVVMKFNFFAFFPLYCQKGSPIQIFIGVTAASKSFIFILFSEKLQSG